MPRSSLQSKHYKVRYLAAFSGMVNQVWPLRFGWYTQKPVVGRGKDWLHMSLLLENKNNFNKPETDVEENSIHSKTMLKMRRQYKLGTWRSTTTVFTSTQKTDSCRYRVLFYEITAKNPPSLPVPAL